MKTYYCVVTISAECESDAKEQLEDIGQNTDLEVFLIYEKTK